MIDIKLKQLNKNAVIPSLGSEGAACYDLVITEIIPTEYAVNKITVKYGIATEIPIGYKAIISPRSSFTNKGWIMANNIGIIDSDYRGEWMSKFEAIPNYWEETHKSGSNHTDGYFEYLEFPYKVGDRVTQFSIEKVIPSKISVVEELNDSTRSTGGFGSTGK